MQADRRAVLGAALLIVATEASAQPRRRGTPPAPPEHDMDHMQHGAGGETFALTPPELIAVNALSTCRNAGEICLSHCMTLMSAGDVSVAACAKAAREMLAVCEASQKLIETHSNFAGQQLALCRAVCDACRSQCAPHAPHHVACATCAQSCAAVMAAIDALLG